MLGGRICAGGIVGRAVDTEQAAILRVLESETAAFFSKDYDAWADCWVHSEHVKRWSWYPVGGVTIESGWARVSALMRKAMQDFPQPVSVEIRRENFSFRIAREIAWVTYDQYSSEVNDPFSVHGLQHELKIFERIGDDWKLACVSVLKPRQRSVECPVLEVDDRGRIVWMNQLARVGITRHAGLRVSGGTLCARDRISDRDLRSAIRWAAGLQDYMHQQAAKSRLSITRGAVPVILRNVECGGLMVCWVRTEDASILVSFDDDETVRHRLSAAAVVFRLSPAQARLSQEIVDGHDLTQAAAALGTRVTTARTQLQRVFDKTGVRSQLALVRVLLSTGAPGG
jgi:DNA-binding CsgD family transcriptional regulator